MTVEQCIQAFLNGKIASASNLQATATNELFSYGLRIAKLTPQGVKLLDASRCVKPCGSPSRTTVKHRNKVSELSLESGITVMELGS